MFFRSTIFVWPLVISAVLVAPVDAQPPAPPAPNRVVLLRNGSYLAGAVRREEGGCRVSFPKGGEIFLPNDQIDLIARNLEHGYQIKRAALESGLAPEQIELAEWCLRHQLLPQSAHHLLRAMSLDREHPRIAGLEHRLRLAAEQQALAAKNQPPEALADRQVPEERQNDSVNSTVGELPPEALERFAATVQPVLLNRCSSAGCHGRTADNPFRLLRPTPGTRISRNATLQNMRAAAEMVDRESPQRSPLLTVPSGPHGPLRHGLFAPHEQGQLERLAQWADLVAAGRGGYGTAVVRSPNQQLLQRLHHDPFPNPGQGPAPDHGGFPRAGLRQESPLPEQPTGVDPFDPAEFNRRRGQPIGQD